MKVDLYEITTSTAGDCKHQVMFVVTPNDLTHLCSEVTRLVENAQARALLGHKVKILMLECKRAIDVPRSFFSGSSLMSLASIVKARDALRAAGVSTDESGVVVPAGSATEEAQWSDEQVNEMQHLDRIREIQFAMQSQVPTAVFFHRNDGQTVAVKINGGPTRYVIAKKYQGSYTGRRVVTEAGAERIVKRLQVDLAARETRNKKLDALIKQAPITALIARIKAAVPGAIEVDMTAVFPNSVWMKIPGLANKYMVADQGVPITRFTETNLIAQMRAEKNLGIEAGLVG